MNLENMKRWAFQPDACRCCLATNGTLDLITAYTRDGGIKEVYSEMLQDCYGISVSCLMEWGCSRLVCKECVNQIRSAFLFRQQVLQSEELIMECYKRGNADMPVKTEILPLENDNDGLGCITPCFSPEDEDIDFKIQARDSQEKATVKLEKKLNKTHPRKRQKTLKTKRKRRKDVETSDSDIPIAELLKNTIIDDNMPKESKSKENIPTRLQNKEERHHVGISEKQLSEHKRIVITCDTVLKNTTACPFRHHKSWFRCFFCTQDFMEISLLRDHTNEMHANVADELKRMKRYPRSLQIDISNLECRECNLNLTDVDSMRRHFVDVHEKVIFNESIADFKLNRSPYSCHLCDRRFHVFRTLTSHLNEHYANCVCDVCGKSFLNSKRLKVHKRTHENGQFPCKECGKVLLTKIAKANHMDSAHAKRVIKCQICFKPMKHYNQRIKHMSDAHNITNLFKCPMCPREYNVKHYLVTHMRQTHGHKDKKCPDCDMAFTTNHNLKKHMLKHTGVKSFTCNVCNKSYSRNYTLREHMRSHENDA